jgi:hypothetical protein
MNLHRGIAPCSTDGLNSSRSRFINLNPINLNQLLMVAHQRGIDG